jgi:hypothetical protein
MNAIKSLFIGCLTTNTSFFCCSNLKNNVVVPDDAARDTATVCKNILPRPVTEPAIYRRPPTPNPRVDFRVIDNSLLDEAKTLIRDTFVYGYFVFWVFLVHRRFLWQPYNPRMEVELP